MKYRAESNMYNLGSVERNFLRFTRSEVQLRVDSTCSSCKQGFSCRSQDTRSCEISLSTPRSYQGFWELKCGSLDVPASQSMMPCSHAWTQYPLTSQMSLPQFAQLNKLLEVQSGDNVRKIATACEICHNYLGPGGKSEKPSYIFHLKLILDSPPQTCLPPLICHSKLPFSNKLAQSCQVCGQLFMSDLYKIAWKASRNLLFLQVFFSWSNQLKRWPFKGHWLTYNTQ